MVDAGTSGAPNWVDLSTPDIGAATRFYRDLLGWTVTKTTTPMGDYYIGEVADQQVGGMMQPGPGMAGTPAIWTVFVYVDDLDQAVANVDAVGGKLLQPPFDIPGEARVAVVADPTGAMLGLIAGPPAEGTWYSHVHGAVCWVELLTRDTTAAEGFYTAVFGWKSQCEVVKGTPYAMFQIDETDIAGMMMMPDEVPIEAPSHWSVYFAVDDCVDVEQRTVDLGGAVLQPTMDVGIGRFAVLADPDGAKFNIIEFAAD
jgi:predicted enzyme related to lactoylglutathione lyase